MRFDDPCVSVEIHFVTSPSRGRQEQGFFRQYVVDPIAECRFGQRQTLLLAVEENVTQRNQPRKINIHKNKGWLMDTGADTSAHCVVVQIQPLDALKLAIAPCGPPGATNGRQNPSWCSLYSRGQKELNEVDHLAGRRFWPWRRRLCGGFGRSSGRRVKEGPNTFASESAVDISGILEDEMPQVMQCIVFLPCVLRC